MAVSLEETIPTIMPPDSIITRKKVLNMDTLHDCRYVSRGDLADLPSYAKALFIEGLAMHLKRTQHLDDIPVDPEESKIDGNNGRIAEMIKKLLPDLEGANAPSFSDLEADMTYYFIASGYNIQSTVDEEIGDINIYDGKSPPLTKKLREGSAESRHALFNTYKDYLIGPGMMYTTSDAGFKVFGDLAEDHPFVTAFFTPQTVADSAGKSYKQLGENFNIYRVTSSAPEIPFKSISNIFTSEQGMLFGYTVKTFDGVTPWDFQYTITGPPGSVIFDFEPGRLSGTSLPACGLGYISGLPLALNAQNPHLTTERQKERVQELLADVFARRPSMLNTTEILRLNIPELFLDMKRCQDSDQALAAYYANQTDEMRNRVVFVTGDRICFLLAILFGIASVLSVVNASGAYMWYWSPRAAFREVGIAAIPVVPSPEPAAGAGAGAGAAAAPKPKPKPKPATAEAVAAAAAASVPASAAALVPASAAAALVPASAAAAASVPASAAASVPAAAAAASVPAAALAPAAAAAPLVERIVGARIITTRHKTYVCQPVASSRKVGGGSSDRSVFKELCSLMNLHVGSIIAKRLPEFKQISLLSNAIQKADYSFYQKPNPNGKKTATIDLVYALSVMKMSITETLDLYGLMDTLIETLPNPIKHISELYTILEPEIPSLIDALNNLLKELEVSKYPQEVLNLVSLFGSKTFGSSRMILSMAILALLDAPRIESTLSINTGSPVYWTLYGFKNTTRSGEDIYFAGLNFIVNEDANSTNNKTTILQLCQTTTREPFLIPEMRTGRSSVKSVRQMPIPALVFGGKRHHRTIKKRKQKHRKYTRKH